MSHGWRNISNVTKNGKSVKTAWGIWHNNKFMHWL